MIIPGIYIETKPSYLTVAFSPDGGLLAGGGQHPNTLAAWDTATGQERYTLPPQAASVRSVALSPDGTLLACATGDFEPGTGALTLHHAPTGQKVATLPVHPDTAFTSVAFSSGGRLLAAGGSINRQAGVMLWDLAHQSAASHLLVPGKHVHAVCFSPDGTLLAAGGDDHPVRVWDIASREVLLSCDTRSGVYALAFSPDGTSLITGGNWQPSTIWSLPDGQVLGTVPTDNLHTVYSVACSPDGRLLLTGAGNDYEKHGVVRLWDLVTGREFTDTLSYLDENGSTEGPVYAVAISSDGRKLAAADYFGIYVWLCNDL